MITIPLKGSALFAMVSLVVIIVSTSLIKIAYATDDRPTLIDRNDIYAELLAEAETNGTVRIFVGLNGPQTDPEVRSAWAEDTYQQRVLTAQKQLIAALNLSSDVVNHQYIFMPVMSLTVNAETLRNIISHPSVQYVEPVRLRRLLLAESTTLIGADRAWDAGFTGDGQVVAIIDTGVDSTHPALRGKVVSEACYSRTILDANIRTVCPGGRNSTIAGSGTACTVNGCDHGTHVAGIVASNGLGIQGVAPNADIIAIQVFSSESDESDCRPRYESPCVTAFDDDIIEGLQRVLALNGTFNIAAVNLSLGDSVEHTYLDFVQMDTKLSEIVRKKKGKVS